jgi:6,7-dimethyl-8-ribityllumazine synthase
MSRNSSYIQLPQLSAKGLRIGIVTGRFNLGVTEKLETGAREELLKLGADPDNITQVRVPGAFEIPLAAKALLEAGCDGVVALGAVIRGETTHYDYVCSAVERGCTETSLQLGKPIGFGILTTENEEQAYDRAGGKHGNKGAEAAQVTVEMARLLSVIAKTATNQSANTK